VSSPVKLPPQPESPPVAKVHAEGPKVSSGSDPMICDSASIHGRYMGSDVTPPVSMPQNPFDDSKEKPPAALRPMTPRSPVPRAEKKSNAIEGKSTSWWDEAFNSPGALHIVSNADFSIPAPPLPSDADESATASWTAISEPASLRPSNPQHVGRSRSRAWFAVGIAAGLAMSAVIWRRRRSGVEPQGE
jgi:hypothetical protein